MKIELIRAAKEDAEEMWKLQLASFAELLERYQDLDTNPGNEPLSRTIGRLKKSFTYFYFIQADGRRVGGIRIRDFHDGATPKEVGPLFLLPEWRGRGLAQEAIRQAEAIHGAHGWVLETILQEPRNLHLYEKMGYRSTGETHVVNERMTLIRYEKA